VRIAAMAYGPFAAYVMFTFTLGKSAPTVVAILCLVSCK
jgi:hypothetical protein